MTAETFARFKIGDLSATIVSDGPLSIMPRENIFLGISKAEFQTHLAGNGLATDEILLGQNALVLDTNQGRVLFETGLGRHRLYGDNTGKLQDNLHAAAIDPREITAVVITHAHPDHCWGLLAEDGKPIYEQAKIFMSKRDFDYYTDEAKLADGKITHRIRTTREQLLPLEDRIVFIDDSDEFLPNVRAFDAAGHSPGQLIFVIRSRDQALAVTGDLVHYPFLEMSRPELENPLDYNSAMAAGARRRILAQLADDNVPLLSYHFRWPGLGRVIREGSGFQFIPSGIR